MRRNFWNFEPDLYKYYEDSRKDYRKRVSGAKNKDDIQNEQESLAIRITDRFSGSLDNISALIIIDISSKEGIPMPVAYQNIIDRGFIKNDLIGKSITTLLDENNSKVIRIKSAEILKSMGPDALLAAPALLYCIEKCIHNDCDDGDAEIAEKCADAIGEIGANAMFCVPRLIDFIRFEHDNFIDYGEVSDLLLKCINAVFKIDEDEDRIQSLEEELEKLRNYLNGNYE